MYKKLKFIIAGVAIVAGLASAVSCQDLSKDVESLGNRLTTLENTVKTLEGKINGGAVITNVASSATGVTVTLSDGKTFTISNGAKGDKGDKGDTGPAGSGTPGTVVTIGANGNWFLDGVDTGLKAAGQDGKDGKDGVDGKPGKDGESIYWAVSEDGKKFVEFKDGVATGKEVVIPAAAGTITAVWDEKTGSVTFYGVEGLEDGYVIGGDGSLKSLVFVPEVYIDGVEGFTFKNFQFKPKGLKTPDSKTEIQTEADKVKNINPATLVSYHVNPANADLSFLKEGKSDGLKFVIIEKDYVKTRAAASKDFGAVAKFKKFEKGILTVEVEISGTPATAEKISMLALEVTTPSGATVTSDYATTMKEDLDKLAIALPNGKIGDKNVINLDPTAKDAHYRRASQGISVVDAKAYIADKAAWTDGDSDIKDAEKTCDLTVKFNSSIDLKEYVAAHKVDDAGADKAPAQLSANDLASLGLTWEFAAVKNYKIGKAGSETDQINFVKLEDGVFTPKVYETTGEAAIGRTPIVRVALKNGSDVVEYAYIKVFISDKEADPAKPFDAEYKFDKDVVYDCKDKELNTDVKYMNVMIYNAMGMSKDAFHALYNKVDLDFVPDGMPTGFKNVGVVTENENPEAEGTYTLKWVLSKDEIWNAKGEAVHFVKYYNDANPKLFAVVKLVTPIADIKKAYNITKADYISNYWDDPKEITFYNVAVPTKIGDTDPNNCVFVNDINASFVTWPKGSTEGVVGVLKLDKSVTKIQYYFCNTHKVTDLKVDGKAVTFSVKNDGLELWGKTTGAEELIATIKNDGVDVPNTITLNKDGELAKKLLNVDSRYFYVYLGAKGIVCSDDTKEVTITFDGKDHFKAQYIRPVDITDTAADFYIDAVDYGEEGSFISIEDLIAPMDWRGRPFVDEFITYWDFYGKFDVKVDLDNVLCDLNGVTQKVPATVVLEEKSTAEMKTISGDDKLDSKYGYLTYKNNGTAVKDFNLFLTVTVKYGWGEIVAKGIKVPVVETIADN